MREFINYEDVLLSQVAKQEQDVFKNVVRQLVGDGPIGLLDVARFEILHKQDDPRQYVSFRKQIIGYIETTWGKDYQMTTTFTPIETD